MSVAIDWDMPAPGEWTTDDLDALPDDGRRYELIDGVPIVSPSPTTGHQRLAGRLFAALDALCPPELAVTRCHVLSHERGVLIVLIKAELQLAHPPEIPRQSASITVDLDPVPALLPH